MGSGPGLTIQLRSGGEVLGPGIAPIIVNTCQKKEKEIQNAKSVPGRGLCGGARRWRTS